VGRLDTDIGCGIKQKFQRQRRRRPGCGASPQKYIYGL
jgi:hypothetical protein